MFARPLATLLLSGLFSASAAAGLTQTGTHFVVNYGDHGLWNWDMVGDGFSLYDADGALQPVTFPGTPWNHLNLGFTRGGTNQTYELASDGGTAWTASARGVYDWSSGPMLTTYSEYSAGDAQIRKAERFDPTTATLTVTLEVTNQGALTLNNVTLLWGFDPDTDSTAYSVFDVYSDVADLDGDRVPEWASAVGPSSGLTVGVLACGPADLGFTWAWGSPGYGTTIALSDPDGALEDTALYWRTNLGSISPGRARMASFVVVTGLTGGDAEALAMVSDPMCDLCDTDGDGAMAADCGGVDCDDTNPAILPGARDYCDGIDDDCDGYYDEDVSTRYVYYWDGDGDGWGDDRYTTLSCGLPAGYAYSGGDCDDSNPLTYPFAYEQCDGQDNDCDGPIDDADPPLDPATSPRWYEDRDGDGAGDDFTAFLACEPGSESTAVGGDCDDGDPGRSPLLEEIPYDGVDQDCDGRDLCDQDGDGEDHGDCGGPDCDDLDPAVSAHAREIPGDGIDNDCVDGDEPLPDEDSGSADGADGSDGADGADGSDGSGGTDGTDEAAGDKPTGCTSIPRRGPPGSMGVLLAISLMARRLRRAPSNG